MYEIGTSLWYLWYTTLQYKLDNLQQIDTYKSLTNQWAITLCTVDSQFFNHIFALLTVCFPTSQSATTLFALLLSQSVSYYTFLHCLHVQEKHVATLFGIYCTVVNGA